MPPEPRSRVDVLNVLAAMLGCRRYLEIGLGPVEFGRSYSGVHVLAKTSVDPNESDATYQMTSDEFFAGPGREAIFDLIFVDGLHHQAQVLRDVQNSLSHLAAGGAVVVHDCSPRTERAQSVPRPANQPAWNGDVWKAWARLKMTRSDLQMAVVDVDHGCGVIRPGTQRLVPSRALTWSQLRMHRQEMLNLVSWSQWRT